MGIFTVRFWKRAVERAVKSFGQGAVTGATLVSGVSDLSWIEGATATGLSMAALSVFTSLGSAVVTGDEDNDDPSLVE